MELHYATYKTDLGHLLLARTEKGLCTLSLAENRGELEKSVKQRHPEAVAAPEDPTLKRWAAMFAMRVKAGAATKDIPLDLQGTPFQQRVWKAMARIPRGQTRSYAELAKAMGAPKAYRAVAQACGANPIAVLIPCHRVVRTDGSLGGYRWGLNVKKRLLALEQQ